MIRLVLSQNRVYGLRCHVEQRTVVCECQGPGVRPSAAVGLSGIQLAPHLQLSFHFSIMSTESSHK